MKDKLKYIIPIIIMLIILISLVIVFNNKKIKIKEYKNNNFQIKYDSTWNKEETKNGIKLEHKKTNSILSIESKELESIYIDTKLSDISQDILDGIIEQNKGFELVNYQDNKNNNNYESYSYLFELEEEQVLVNLYKKDNILIIVYYDSSFESYDIVLDSVDAILNSLIIYSGEK